MHARKVQDNEDDANEKPARKAHVSLAPPAGKFISPGIILFIDQLIVAAGGWLYWLVISKFTTSSEIGQATTVYSLVMLTTTITQLGLEYPLLKKSSSKRSEILGTAIALEMAMTLVSLPLVFLAIGNLYGESLQDFIPLAGGILVLTSLGFISRFVLLGISNSRSVLIFDLMGTAAKFVAGYALVSNGFGTFGILVSFLISGAIICGGTLFAAREFFGFRLGSRTFALEIIKEGLANAPSKLSRMFIMSLSIVLLASFGISSSDVGIFYIAVMISFAVGSFASSIAYMSIPAASSSKTDLSSSSMRIGLTFTAPIIAILLAEPGFILSLIGSDYVSAEFAFLVLSIAIFPSSIMTNAITRLNNLNKFKELILIGSVQLMVFLVAFFVLSPMYSTLGAALSMLIALSASAALSIFWLGKSDLKYIATSGISVGLGWAVSYLLHSGFMGAVNPLITIFASLTVTSLTLLAFKNTSISELLSILRTRTSSQDSPFNNYPQNNSHQTCYLLIGNYGNSNIGDEILLKRVVGETMMNRTRVSTMKFFIPSRNLEFTRIYHQDLAGLLSPIRINDFSGLARAFMKSEAIIIGGGGIWSKYTGPFAHLIPIVALIGKVAGKKVHFKAIGVYSTAKAYDRFLVNLAVVFADSCTVRDGESHSLLWKSNKRKAKVVDDLAIPHLREMKNTTESGRPSIAEYERIMAKKVQSKKIIVGLSFKPVRNPQTTSNIVREVSDAINHLNSKYPNMLHFVFFPFAKTNSILESDLDLASNITSRLSTDADITIVEHTDPVAWFLAIKDLVDIFIGMRHHSIIFACEAMKPVLCIPYENKTTEFLKNEHENSENISILGLNALESSKIASFVESRLEMARAKKIAND